MDKQGNVIIYQSEDGVVRLDVRLEDKTVWLTIDQMAELFSKSRSTINEHILHIYEEGELEEDKTVYGEKDEGVGEITQEAERVERRLEIGGVLPAQEELEHVGLDAGDERHGGGCQPGGVAEDVNSQTEDEAENHEENPGRAALRAKYEPCIYERDCHTEKMDAAEEQRLEEGEDDYGYEGIHSFLMESWAARST